MRILVDLTSLADNFSGIERFALSITKEIINNRQNQYVLLFKNKVHSEFETCGSNVKCVVIGGNKKLIFNQILLPLALLKYKCDRYFFPAFPAPFFFFSGKSVSAIHDLGCWDCPGCNKFHMEFYFKLLYWKASLCRKKIVTVSEFSKQRISNILKVKKDNILVAYNGIGELFTDYQATKSIEESTRKKYSLPDHYLLCLSTLEPRKNLQLLIDAYSKLVLSKKIDCELVLAGRKGWMFDSVLSNIDITVVNRIHFTGFIDDENLPAVYKMADCFVFPSFYEGFGIPPVEAMSVGTNVISSDSSSLPEVLGDAAIYFKNNDGEDLQKKILEAISMSDAEKAKLREEGYRVSKQYRWEISASKINEWFK